MKQGGQVNEGLVLKREGGSEDRFMLINKGRGVSTRTQLALGYHVWVHGAFDWYSAPFRGYGAPGRFLRRVEDLPEELVHGEGLSDAEILRRVAALLEQGYLVDFWAGRGGQYEADVFVFRDIDK